MRSCYLANTAEEFPPRRHSIPKTGLVLGKCDLPRHPVSGERNHQGVTLPPPTPWPVALPEAPEVATPANAAPAEEVEDVEAVPVPVPVPAEIPPVKPPI